MFSHCTFQNATVQLGGRAFDHCRFVECEIEYNGGPLQLTSNEFVNCRWKLTDAAETTVAFLRMLCTASAEHRGEVLRLLGADQGRPH